MIPAGLIDGAFHQTQAMARTIGVNLTTAIAERQLPADTPAQMIARCQTCAFPKSAPSGCRKAGSGTAKPLISAPTARF